MLQVGCHGERLDQNDVGNVTLRIDPVWQIPPDGSPSVFRDARNSRLIMWPPVAAWLTERDRTLRQKF
jgi:hypothetical protein